MPDKPRYDGIPLDIALDNIATAFDLDTDTLIDYAGEDSVGGYHASYDDGFPIGSMWRVEGQILYALTRALKPQNVLELGTSRGCSATHILTALLRNGGGFLECVDNGSHTPAVGDLIPSQFEGRYQIHRIDMEDFIATTPDASYDLILEDGMHSPEQVEMVWRAAWRLLRPGGMIFSHDAEHFVVGEAVREGIARAGYFSLSNPARTYLIAPSDCGYGVWRKPFETDGERVDMPAKAKRKRKTTK